MQFEIEGHCLVPGRASGEIVFSGAPLSFWMGTDTETGAIVDEHHPGKGQSFAGRILVIPGGRGSCSGSGALLEMIMHGSAPAALVIERDDMILAVGAIIADELFGKSIPIVSVGSEGFARLRAASYAAVVDGVVTAGDRPMPTGAARPTPGAGGVDLTASDRAMLGGAEGPARQLAMRIITRVAGVQRAPRLVDVAQAHIDGCFYTGPAGLAAAEKLAAMGGRVKVPATTNSTTVDARRWRAFGVDPRIGESSDRVAAAYVAMGVRPTFTCAPYLLETAPGQGEQIAWGESNAVAFANSVIGARTMKYPDFLDICVALTGRGPYADCHDDAQRRPRVRFDVTALEGIDDSLYPLLGHLVGSLANDEIPLVTGLEQADPTLDDLKAFSAAFATTASASMFHIAGVTPEARHWRRDGEVAKGLRAVDVGSEDLVAAWRELNSARSEDVRVVALGNPHFSLTEFGRLAGLIRGRTKDARVALTITTSRAVHEQAAKAGLIAALETFGATVLTDTCWCMLCEPMLPPGRTGVLTNSAKYAHYGPGMIGQGLRFAGLAECVEAACTGRLSHDLPRYLEG